jgi:hypothetical protein
VSTSAPPPEEQLIATLAELLRPIVAGLVREEFERLASAPSAGDERASYLTVAQYAERHQATAAAIRARIRRGSLPAIRPPGGREYLIPNDAEAGGHG